MINRFKKIQCPYCNAEMQLGDCKVIAAVSGNVIVDPSQKRPIWGTSITGKKGARALATRQCVNPNCNKLLPRNIEFVDQNITIAVIGDTFSGKSHYIAALIEQLRSGRYLPPGYNLCLLDSAEPETEEIYQRDFYQPLFLQSQVLAGTRQAFDSMAEPLIYELTLEGQSRKQINLIIYDVKGEDLVNQHNFISLRPHLFNAKGILYMADPWAIDGFRNRLAHHLQPDSSYVTGRVAMNILWSIIKRYQDHAGRTGNTRINIPVGIVITKADLIPYLAVDPYYQDLFNPNFEHIMDIDTNSPIDGVIKKLFQDIQEPGLVNLANSKLERSRFFVTSATGSPADMNSGVYQSIKPYRCLDPLFWLLRDLHVIY